VLRVRGERPVAGVAQGGFIVAGAVRREHHPIEAEDAAPGDDGRGLGGALAPQPVVHPGHGDGSPEAPGPAGDGRGEGPRGRAPFRKPKPPGRPTKGP